MSAAIISHTANTLLGPELIGALASAALWGMSCLQAYTFFARGTNDRPALKIMVTALVLLNTFNTVLTSHIPYYFLVTKYADPTVLPIITWSFAAFEATAELSNTLIRVLFAHRVWLLSGGNIWLTGGIVLISLYSLAACIGVSVLFFLYPDGVALEFSPAPQELLARRLIDVSFSGSITADLMVTVSLCYYLYKSKTGFRKTNSLINSLIKYVICTGLTVTVTAVLGMVLHLASPATGYGAMVLFTQAKLYVNSYLALLNSRENLRGKTGVSTGPTHLTFTSGSIATDVKDEVDKGRNQTVTLQSTAENSASNILA